MNYKVLFESIKSIGIYLGSLTLLVFFLCFIAYATNVNVTIGLVVLATAAGLVYLEYKDRISKIK